jgi:hypothetical protein
MQAMYPEAPLVYTNGAFEASRPLELTNSPLYRLSELIKANPGIETNRPRPELDELISMVTPQLDAYADLCAAEDTPATPLSDYPFGDVIPSSYHAITTVYKVLPGLHMDAGDIDGALRSLQSLSQISAYYSRGDELTHAIDQERADAKKQYVRQPDGEPGGDVLLFPVGHSEIHHDVEAEKQQQRHGNAADGATPSRMRADGQAHEGDNQTGPWQGQPVMQVHHVAGDGAAG